MNLPNKLTILRIILVPFFVLFMLLSGDIFPHHNLVALAIFGIASYTDHLDGKIARRDHLITNFGKLMDPLADKIMVMSALVCFVANGMTSRPAGRAWMPHASLTVYWNSFIIIFSLLRSRAALLHLRRTQPSCGTVDTSIINPSRKFFTILYC